MIALALFAALLFPGLIVMTAGLRNAPQGYQTDKWFHLVWCNNSPEKQNIVCIWDYHPSTQGTAHQGGLRAAA